MEKLREKIVVRIHTGDKISTIAKAFGVTHKTVYIAKKLFDETGGYSRRSSGGRPRSACTLRLVVNTAAKIRRNQTRSLSKLAKEADISLMSMCRLVKFNLGMRSRAKVRCQTLTMVNRAKREARSRKILNWMKSNTGIPIVFSDEKNWSVDPHHNCHNTRYVAKTKESVDPSVRYVPRSKFLAKAMSFGLVGTDGWAWKPLWIEGTLNSKRYVDLLKKKIIPALDDHCGPGGVPLSTRRCPLPHQQGHTAVPEEALGVQGVLAERDVAPQLAQPEPLDYHMCKRMPVQPPTPISRPSRPRSTECGPTWMPTPWPSPRETSRPASMPASQQKGLSLRNR